ncbi:MAG: hypothetical protein J6Z12_01720, partial [Paludibacteraceae bacterium]|nr:hypothetical protein [Paludibacteraceae bacterium]
ERFECQIGQGIYVGDTIRSILIAYDHSGDGDYEAWFDDILIEDGQQPPSQVVPVPAVCERSLRVVDHTAYLMGYTDADLTLYTLSGRLVRNWTNVNGPVVLPPMQGVCLMMVRDAKGQDYYKILE